MTEFDIHSLAGAFALDALDPAEAAHFESHLQTCEFCQSEVRDFAETAATLASAESVQPPARLRSSVMANVGQVRQLPPLVDSPETQPANVINLSEQRSARNSRAMRLVGAAAAAIVIVVGVVGLNARSDDGFPQAVEAVVEAEDAVEIALSTAESSTGVLRVIYSDENSEVAVVGSDIAPLTDAQTYALWAIADDEFRPIGVFDPSSDGDIATTLDAIDARDVIWGVTVEPAGGSAQPTTDPVFLSS